MNKTILQVPVDVATRNKALSHAKSLGFSSLQEAVRLFLHDMADKTMHVRFEEKPVILSEKAANRYKKMMEDIESGRVKAYTATSVEDLLDQLHDRKPLVPQKIR